MTIVTIDNRDTRRKNTPYILSIYPIMPKFFLWSVVSRWRKKSMTLNGFMNFNKAEDGLNILDFVCLA